MSELRRLNGERLRRWLKGVLRVAGLRLLGVWETGDGEFRVV